MAERFQLPGDIPVKRTMGKDGKLHVEPIRTAAVTMGAAVTQEEWDEIFSEKEDPDCEEQKAPLLSNSPEPQQEGSTDGTVPYT